MEIRLGKENDIESWMKLVAKVRDNFPGLETQAALGEHRNTVLDFISKDSAICAKDKDKTVGTLLFSKENNVLCFLAVDAEYRRQHIAEKMVSYMLTFMDSQKDVTVATYREGVPEGIAARAFYKRIGFTEGKLTEEFGSPVQEFVLKAVDTMTVKVNCPCKKTKCERHGNCDACLAYHTGSKRKCACERTEKSILSHFKKLIHYS